MKWDRLLRRLVLIKDTEQGRFVKAIEEDPWVKEMSIYLLKNKSGTTSFCYK